MGERESVCVCARAPVSDASVLVCTCVRVAYVHLCSIVYVRLCMLVCVRACMCTCVCVCACMPDISACMRLWMFVCVLA